VLSQGSGAHRVLPQYKPSRFLPPGQALREPALSEQPQAGLHLVREERPFPAP